MVTSQGGGGHHGGKLSVTVLQNKQTQNDMKQQTVQNQALFQQQYFCSKHLSVTSSG